MNKGKMPVEKRSLMQDYFLVQEKNFLIILEAKYFWQKILNQNQNQQYLIHRKQQQNEPGNLTCVKIFIIKSYTKNKCKDWKYQSLTFSLKYLLNSDKTRNHKIVSHVNNALIDLRNAINRKKISEKETPNKGVYILEEILDFNKKN